MKITFVLLLLCSYALQAKVRILTFHCNKPDFIELQYKTFNNFLKDDFEIIVFNDGNIPEREEAVRSMCEKYGIQCIRFEPEWHLNDPLNAHLKNCLENPSITSHVRFEGTAIEQIAKNLSVRHCHVIQYALDNFGYNNNDPVAIMDGDCFLIRPLSIQKLLRSYHIRGVRRYIAEEDVEYLWVVFIAFDPRKLLDVDQFKCHLDVIKGKMYDSGAHTFHYLQSHPNVRILTYIGDSSTSFRQMSDGEIMKKFGFSQHETWLIKSLPITEGVEFWMNKHLLHYAGSSFEEDGKKCKEDVVKTFLEVITK